MYSAKELAIARLIKPDIEVTQLDVTDLAVLQLVRKATGGGSGVYNATIENGIATFGGVVASSPLVSLKLNIPVTQTGSGTPSPTNIRDIVGVTGAVISRTGTNLWDEEWEVGSYNETTGGKNNTVSTTIRSKNPILIKGGQSYYLSIPSDIRILQYRRDGSYINAVSSPASHIYSPSDEVGYINFRTITAYGTVYNNDISINYPSTDKDYHPYTSNTYQITFGQTVYSAYLDVLTGKLSITHKEEIFDGSEVFTRQSNNRVYTTIYDAFIPETADINTVICSHYEGVAQADSNDMKVWKNTGNSSVTFRDSVNATSATDFKNYLLAQYQANTPVTLIYKLAEPIEIDLTPTVINTLIGENVIFADVANVTECKYTRK